MTVNRKLTIKELVLCSLFAALIAVGAFIRIPVPLMDYFSLQFLFVILAGMLLGSKLGTISVAAYVSIGLVGLICERFDKPIFNHYLGAAFVGLVITYGMGFGYKYMILNFYTKEVNSLWVIVLSSLPLDIPGDIVLCVLGANLANRLRKIYMMED
ncbi:biotin transport system substrate-specific component [Desulfonispora thiosulfatigenes DSM 11270]|uniref:Biotin transporter n=1 Tax=Desulfonispora thiosulfatigenes DSM 11270 TaxID=656914 RepID=A0A1W1V1B9_DESTI|nr:biotin transporter BioY [Desulfonispora thiosulfatigenes]SMB87139.1 biotin transport system substrate-specific component [Desulfonispora thiosulfatigenes DSM 11270]